MDLSSLLFLTGAAAFLSWMGTGWLTRVLRGRLMDVPNERSSHSVPTPRGAGLWLIPLLLGGWFALMIGCLPQQMMWGPVLLTGTAFWLLGALDDRYGLGTLVRFAVQIALVLLVLLFSGQDFHETLLPFLPEGLSLAALTLLWVWWINLYNFMDGIDGITTVETLTIGAGVAFFLLPGGHPVGYAALLMVAVMLGFLPHNWHPAKIFLGDSGSIPLGFLTGWLLLQLAAQGLWAAAIILPLYYFADATITLLRRMLKREKFWQAHRSHYYQQCVQAGAGHSRTSLAIASLNLWLLVIAWVSLTRPFMALALAGGFTLLTLRNLKKGRGGGCPLCTLLMPEPETGKKSTTHTGTGQTS